MDARKELFGFRNSVSDLAYQVHCASKLMMAVYFYLAEGPNAVDQISFDALFAACSHLESVSRELRAAVDAPIAGFPVSANPDAAPADMAKPAC